MRGPAPLSLYIHIPFCKSKCAYCDFASYPGKEAAWETYFAALCEEIRAAKDGLHRVETVFFGGGTPSLVPETYIAGALAAAREAFCFAPGAEVSLEANPGTLTMEKLRAYREMGVDRLSIGVQSFDARLLKDIGRIHAPGEAVEAVRMAKAAGFANIGIDLMYGLPGQTMGAWEATLKTALSLPLTHISAYALIVEAGTPMAAREGELPDEEDVLAMQRRCTRALAAAGFARYEISNYARRGFACRHNLVYWRRGEYLGFGCAAHSFFGGERFRNASDLEGYLRGARGLERERVDGKAAREETVMLATRTGEGLSLENWREDFGEDFASGREKVLEELRRAGLLEIADGRVFLTEKGMEVHNAVVLALL
ncbi:MAG TPA: radical SAM family heme chaperone HemW [Candidatus Pullichristensenella stercoripullorum]|nr:radical SAM family heme chaperone HemW [Candidatus Pullichristensenella stercoripullorum]